jgi:hypothetical protein
VHLPVATTLRDPPQTQKITGQELCVGDVLVTASGQRPITRITPHPALSQLYQQPVAIAYAGSWSRLIFDRAVYQVIRPSR